MMRAPISCSGALPALLLLLALPHGAAGAVLAAPPAPRPLFQAPRELHPIAAPADSAGDSSPSLAELSVAAVRPASLASADFDRDGFPDLLAGYAAPDGGWLTIYQGDRRAFAPEDPEVLREIGAGRFPEPFEPSVRLIHLPEAPDFIAVGDFDHDGWSDVAVAARGSSTFYLLQGSGAEVALSDAIALPGAVTAMVAAEVGPEDGFPELVIAIAGREGAALLIRGAGQATSAGQTVHSLPAEALAIAAGSLDDDSSGDLVILAAGEISILHGAPAGAPGAAGMLERVVLPFRVAALALGDFIWDRDARTEIALAAEDGSIHLAARGSLDTRPRSEEEIRAMRLEREAAWSRGEMRAARPMASLGSQQWEVVEHLAGATRSPVASASRSGQAPLVPLLVRTHVSGLPADDLAAQVPGAGMRVFSPPIPRAAPSPAARFSAARPTELALDGDALALLAMRVGVDGRPGLVALRGDRPTPIFIAPAAATSFRVTGFGDANPPSPNCSAPVGGFSNCATLRDAVRASNADVAADTIVFEDASGNPINGTVVLSVPSGGGTDQNAFTGDLDINGSLTIIGNGAANTIISTSYLAGCGDCKVFGVNQPGTFNGLSVSISGVTIQNGVNDMAVASCGGFFETGGGIDFFLTGTGNSHALTNSIVTNNRTTGCPSSGLSHGGGVNVDSANTATPGGASAGSISITGCTISNNDSGTFGGGIVLAADKHDVTMSDTSVTGNDALTADGGGIWIRHSFGGTVNIGKTVAGTANVTTNTGTQGGGVSVVGNQVVNLTNLTISGNTATGSVGTALGGGIIVQTLGASGVTGGTTLTGVTISGNHADAGTGNGGGVYFSGFYGAALNNCTVSGNTADQGAGLWTQGNNSSPALHYTVAGGTLTGNVAAAEGGGLGNNNSIAAFTDLSNLTITGNSAANGGGVAVLGGGVTVTGATITGNTGTASGGALFVGNAGALNVGLSRIAGNTSPSGSGIARAGTATATVENDWWACDGFPNAPGCQTGAGTFDADPRIDLRLTTAPGQMMRGGASTLTALVNQNTNAVAINPTVLNGLPITFTAAQGTALPSPVNLSALQAASTYTNDGTCGLPAVGATLDNGTQSATIVVVCPPILSKAFGAATIAVGGSTSLTFTVNNPNTTVGLSGIAFTDTLPAGLSVTSGSAPACGGTVTRTAPTTVAFSGGALAASGSCNFAVTVTGVVDGQQDNTSGAIGATESGVGTTSNTASILVINPPSLSKLFGAAAIPQGTTTSLTFTVSNSNTTQTLNGVAFNDPLPAGLTVASGSGPACGGTLTTTAPNLVDLTGGSLAPNGSCNGAVTITGATAGVWNNVTAAVSSTNGGTGNTANDSLTVVGPPGLAKAFGAPSIALGSTTSLTFTITNANTTQGLSGIAFTDALPAGVTVASGSGPACGGTLTTTAPDQVAFSGGTVAATSSCNFAVTVTGATSGTKNNVTGTVGSIEGGTGGTAADAVVVVSPPDLAKAFGAPSIALGSTTSLAFTITNPNVGAGLSGVAFSDTLPAGVTVATGSTPACGGTLATTAPSQIDFTGGSLAGGANCGFAVTVTGASAGPWTNLTGNVGSTEGGTGGTATADLTVIAPPLLAKAFGSPTVALGGATNLTFTITNPNVGAGLSGVAFSDTLPAGVTVATGSTPACGGTLATTAPSQIDFTGGSLAGGANCNFAVTVTGASAGPWTNLTGNVGSTEGGVGGTATADVSVVEAPTLGKAFGAPSIPLGGSTSLTFTVSNPSSTTTLTGLAFTDVLPAGLTVASGSSGACGGTATTTAPDQIVLAGGSLAPSASCNFAVTVTGATPGAKDNTTGAVSSVESGPGGTAQASLTVVAPPTISKAFGAIAIPTGGATSLSFSITNPNAGTMLTGVGFTDTLPAGLVVATPNGLSGACGGGTIVATAGTALVSLSNASLAGGASCNFAVDVQAIGSGPQANTTSPVASVEGGAGNTAVATVSVDGTPPTVLQVTTVPDTGDGVLTAGEQTSVDITAFVIRFSEDVQNPFGDAGDDVTNPANYQLISAGGNGTVETATCGGLSGDDVAIALGPVSYDAVTFTATVQVGTTLAVGKYRLQVCGSTSILDLAGNPLQGGGDFGLPFEIISSASVVEIPTLDALGLALLVLAIALAAGALMTRRG